MKGYSYPGKSPLKQTKFPKEGRGKLEKLIKKILTPKKKTPKKEEYDIQGGLLPEVNVKPWPENTEDLSRLANKLKVDPKISNETNIRDRINKFRRLSTKTTKHKKKKDGKSVWDNKFLREVAVGTIVGMLTKEKEEFVPVNIAGKQKKIM